jgi:uncharacterized protein (TIGR02145 family)
MTSLTAGTVYYVRAYATNSGGTAYGAQLTFSTRVTDADLNTYSTVIIGTQLWMGESLKTTKYTNGTTIPTTPDINTDISGESNPEYQWPVDGDEANVAAYGRLYTWYAVTNHNVCPTGFHVPSDTELETLKAYLGGQDVAGGKLKETGTAHWQSPNTGATNETHFTALPASYRVPAGTFIILNEASYLWSATNGIGPLAWGQGMIYTDATLIRNGYTKTDGVSVRCMK